MLSAGLCILASFIALSSQGLSTVSGRKKSPAVVGLKTQRSRTTTSNLLEKRQGVNILLDNDVGLAFHSDQHHLTRRPALFIYGEPQLRHACTGPYCQS